MTCAYAVRVAIMKVPGVESADVSLNKGLATVKLKPGNNIRPSQFWEAIRKNGNTPKNTRVTVRGEVLSGGAQLRVTNSAETFELKPTPETAQRIKDAAGKTVTIEGTLTPGKDVKTAVPLEVTAVRP
jgi:copper chaperone CopZ